MPEHVAPNYESERFNCPICNTFAQQNWINNEVWVQDKKRLISRSKCQYCQHISIWINFDEDNNDIDGKIIFPLSNSAPPPNEDMPEEISKIYNEAKNIFSLSPKASAALLRLAIEKLMPILGANGNLNTAIGNLVNEGLPQRVQQALDIVRVIGNNAVHPGQINIDDNKETALTLFRLINLVIEKTVTEERMVDEIYSTLPENQKQAIERRDNQTE